MKSKFERKLARREATLKRYPYSECRGVEPTLCEEYQLYSYWSVASYERAGQSAEYYRKSSLSFLLET